jgi:hypothetical protein
MSKPGQIEREALRQLRSGSPEWRRKDAGAEPSRTAALERRVATLRAVLREQESKLAEARAEDAYGLRKGSVVLDSEDRPGLVTRIEFPAGCTRPWVWTKRRLAGDRYQEVAKCLTDAWKLPPPEHDPA